MIATCVHVEVLPEYCEAFIEECRKNHDQSVHEPDNLRFDVLQETDNACKFLLYEAYKSETAAAAHKQTPHYHTWRTNVEKMMAGQRFGIKHKILYPSDFNK